MEIKDRIADMRDKLQKMKSQRGILTKVQIFKFQPFSRRQKQVLTWWMPGSPVKDYDGIIADGAILGKNGLYVAVLCVLGDGELQRSELRNVRQDDRFLSKKRSILAEANAQEPRVQGCGSSGR